MLFNANTVEYIKKLTNVNNLNNNAELIFKLGQIRGVCDQILAENAYIERDKKATAEVIEHMVSDNKTFAEKCKEIIPEDKPCTDDDEKIIKLLERNGSHMNLKFELSQRFPNKQYAKTVYNLLAKDGICTMQDLMEIFDDYEKLHLIKYYQSAKKDDLKKLNEIFPVFELGDITCNKIAAMYEAANEYHGKTAGDILTDFVGPVRHRNAIMRFGILNMNQLYYYCGHHTLKEYRGIRNVGIIPDNVLWLYNYIHKDEKKN